MALPKSGTLTGLEFAQVWRVGTNSRAYGVSDPEGTLPAIMTPLLLRYPRSAQFPAINRVIVALTGGNKWRGNVMFGVGSVDQFPLVLGDTNSQLHAMSGNSAVDETTNAQLQFFADNMENAQLPVCGLALTSFYHSSDFGLDAEPFWMTMLLPRCQIASTAPAPAYQAAADNTYNVIPDRCSHLPNGLPLEDTGMNLAKNKAMAIFMVSQYPVMIESFIGNGTLDDFQMTYKPKTTAVGTASNTKNWFVKNGVPEALASMTADGLASTTAAPANGAYGNIMYQVDPNLPLAS